MSKLASIVKYTNMTLAVLLVAIGIWQFIVMILNITFETFYYFFLPFFIVLLGCMLFAAELKVPFVIEYFKFLQTLLGRGIYNIFLASMTVYNISESTNSSFVGFIYGLVVMGVGVFFLILHVGCCGSETVKEMKEELLA